MRIVIESEENVVIAAERPSTEPSVTRARQVIDAGPAPADLLRRFGRVPPTEAEARGLETREEGVAPAIEAGGEAGRAKAARGTRPSPSVTETPLNPLRAGAAVARARAGGKPGIPEDSGRPEKIETIDAGSAPKIARPRKKDSPGRGPGRRSR